MKQQTAVEWLASNLDIVWEEKIIDLVEQAKQMEKEQIEKAFQRGISYKSEQNKSAYYSSKRFHKKYF